MKTRVAIMGYGNLGRGVELALRNSPDMEFVAVFSRRDPAKVSIKTTDVPVISVNDIDAYQDKVDVLIICGGSATDLPKQTPQYVKKFNVVDSFDTHACIPDHLRPLMQPVRKQITSGSSPLAGIRAYFPLPASIAMPSFP